MSTNTTTQPQLWPDEHDGLRQCAESQHRPNSRYRRPAGFELPNLPAKGWPNSGVCIDGAGYVFNTFEGPNEPEFALLSDLIDPDSVPLRNRLTTKQAEKMLAKLHKYGKDDALADRLRQYIANHGGEVSSQPSDQNIGPNEVRQQELFT